MESETNAFPLGAIVTDFVNEHLLRDNRMLLWEVRLTGHSWKSAITGANEVLVETEGLEALWRTERTEMIEGIGMIDEIASEKKRRNQLGWIHTSLPPLLLVFWGPRALTGNLTAFKLGRRV